MREAWGVAAHAAEVARLEAETSEMLLKLAYRGEPGGEELAARAAEALGGVVRHAQGALRVLETELTTGGRMPPPPVSSEGVPRGGAADAQPAAPPTLSRRGGGS